VNPGAKKKKEGTAAFPKKNSEKKGITQGNKKKSVVQGEMGDRAVEKKNSHIEHEGIHVVQARKGAKKKKTVETFKN